MRAAALRRLPIVARAPLAAAAMTALVGLVASWLVLGSLARVQEDRLRELVRLHVDGLSVALGPAVLRRDVWEVYDTLDRAAAAGEGRRLALTVVAGEDGRVLAASDPRRAPLDSPLAAIGDGAQTLDALDVLAEGPVIRVLAPLSYQGRGVGRILTELSVADLVAERRRAGLALLLGNALATVALSLAAFAVMRRSLRPLATLAERMDSDAAEPAPIPARDIPRGDTEVARLFRTYNAMVASIAAKADAERRLAERERFVSLGRLASSLAHEINNPLGGLLNAVDTLARYPDRPDVARRAAALLERGLRRLRDVARAALDHNRLDDETAPLGPDDLDDLRLLVSPEIARLGQRLDWKASGDAAALAAFPAARVRQIALNLLLNASAAAGPGGEVGLAVESDGAGLRLTVRDSGPGLGPAALERLLEGGPTAPGGGLGLRITREMVAALGGRIAYARAAGASEIVVTLPAPVATQAA